MNKSTSLILYQLTLVAVARRADFIFRCPWISV